MDTFTDGQTINLFESGSIMEYLIDRYDTDHKISFPKGTRECELTSTADHFTRYAPEHIDYGVKRYQNETRRLYSVLDKHLASDNKAYICGERCTIADIAHYGWVASAGWAGVDIDEFPSLKAWEERMTSRPGVEKGRHVPDPHSIKELLQDKDKMEKYAAESRKWIQGGMKQDAEKQK
ncbi:glutathione S-transferase II [Alternaria alternata]|nr:glutathione S-transferase II [Alternaria alternata]